MDCIINYGWYALMAAVAGEMVIPFILWRDCCSYRLSPHYITRITRFQNRWSFASVVFIAVFAVGAYIFTCFFSVNETKEIVTLASKIYGVGSAIGFMLLLFVPLFLAILSFRSGDPVAGILSSASFALALFFFVLFITADKPEFRQSTIAKEGL